MTTLPEKELLRLDEVAKYCSVTVRTVRRWIEEGRLVAIRLSPRVMRIRVSSVRRLAKWRADQK